MKRLNTSAKKQETSTKIHTKKALVPLFIVTFSLLGFMGYAATHAAELFREPIALPPGGQPSGTGGLVSNLYSVLSAGANASSFINPVLLGGKLIVPTLCFGTSSSSVDCLSSATGLGGGSQNLQQVTDNGATTTKAITALSFIGNGFGLTNLDGAKLNNASVTLAKLFPCAASQYLQMNASGTSWACSGQTTTPTNTDIPGLPPLENPTPGTSTNTAGSGGGIGVMAYHDTVTPADGRPVIAYINPNTHTLEYRRCDNIACTTYITMTLDSSSATGDGAQVAMALGTDGFPIILYPSNGTGGNTLKVTKCTDINCAHSLSNELASFGTNYTTNLAIAVGVDSYPAFAFNLASGALQFVRCTTTTCSSTWEDYASYNLWETKTFPQTPAHTGTVGNDVVLAHHGVAVGSDGRPWMVWRENYQIKLSHCADAVCNTPTAGSTILSGTSSTYPDSAMNRPAMVLAPDGRPLVVYRTPTPNSLQSGTPRDLMYVRCLTDICDLISSGGYSRTLIDSSTTGLGDYVAIAIQNGVPVMAYQNTFERDLRYIRCSDLNCTTVTKTAVVPGNNNDGNFAVITPGGDGFPFIIHSETTTPGNAQQNLYVKCSNISCSTVSTSSTPVSTGTLPTGTGTMPGSATAVSTIGYRGSMVPHAVVVPSDNRPVMVYVNTTTNNLEYRRCGNSTCTNVAATILDSVVDTTSKEVAMTLGLDGLPIILYSSVVSGNTVIKTARCNDLNCSSFQGYTIVNMSNKTVDQPDAQAGTTRSLAKGIVNSLAISVGADSYPAIAFGIRTPDEPKPTSVIAFIRCTTTTCSTTWTPGSFSIMDIEGGNVFPMPRPTVLRNGVAVTADGRPWVAWDTQRGSINVVHCLTNVCNGSNTVSSLTPTSGSGSSYSSGSMTLASDGRVLFTTYSSVYHTGSYFPGGNWVGGFTYIRCGSDLCNTNNATKVIDFISTGTGYHSSIAIQNGVPVISYQNVLEKDLRYIRCSDLNCTAVTKTAVVTGDNDDGNYTAIAPGTEGFPFIIHGETTTPTNIEQNMYVKCTTQTCQ